MITIHDLLNVKGRDVYAVHPGTTVIETLKYLAEKDIGALVVLKNDGIAGIISERDFVRSIAETGKCLLESTVSDYMTEEVFTIELDQSLSDCMKLMTDKHIRHVPVVEKGKLVGVISIGDVVRAIITDHEMTIDQLSNYIEGRGYGH